MQSKALLHVGLSMVDVPLLKEYLAENLQESKALFEVKAKLLSRQNRILEELRIVNAELFLLFINGH